MTAPPRTFNDLRGEVQRGPSPRRWRLLCEAIDAWPDERELAEVALPYLVGSLRRWPDALLEAPRRWVDRLLQGERVAPMLLARQLRLEGRWLGVSGARALAQAPELSHVRALYCHGNALSAASLEALASPESTLTRVEALHLFNNGVGDAGAAAIGGSESLGNLRALSLVQAHLSPDGLEALLAGPLGDRLEHLDLRNNPLRGAGAAALAARPRPALRALDLSSTQLGPSGLAQLVHGDAFPSLESLELLSNGVGDEGVEALVTSEAMRGLRSLGLAYNRVTDRGARAIAEAARARHLTHLNLYGNQLGDEAARALARTPHLGALEELRLELNDLTDRGRHALAQSPHLREDLRARWRG